MAQELTLEYDREGDILEASSSIFNGTIIAKDIGDDVWLKVDEKTGAIAGFLILNLLKRKAPVKLPLSLGQYPALQLSPKSGEG